MAEKRMFAKTIIDSDAFIEMPISSQLLYFHLSMRADDEGFINKPKSIMRMLGCKDDDMNILIMRKFIIPFESGVIVIKHWKINNYLQNDRIIGTKYVEEKSTLELDENKAYRVKKEQCIQNDSKVYTQSSIEESSIEEISIYDNKSKRFVAPTYDEVKSFIDENKYAVDPERFINFYESKGWMVGRNKMKDWKSAVRTWQKSSFTSNKNIRVEQSIDYQQDVVQLTQSEIDKLANDLKSLGG